MRRKLRSTDREERGKGGLFLGVRRKALDQKQTDREGKSGAGQVA